MPVAVFTLRGRGPRLLDLLIVIPALALASLGGLLGCGDSPEVVIYTALDAPFSEPILQAFEAETGIRVRALYDTEAQKTAGLTGRLIAERGRPRCDVFWNNEIVQTIRLKREGLLAPYLSPSAESIPPAWRDAEGYWTGFASRARVLAYNPELVARADLPATLTDLTDPQWKGKVGMAYPLFGTTATHAAVLFAWWGEDEATAFFEALAANDIRIYEGNMSAARAVAAGEITLCLTDTDDVQVLANQGKPIERILIDHRGEGALMIPNTLSLVKGAPHPEAARRLIDYLLSPEVEAILAASPSAQIPLHPGVDAPAHVLEMAAGPFAEVDYEAAAREIEPRAEFLTALFTRP